MMIENDLVGLVLLPFERPWISDASKRSDSANLLLKSSLFIYGDERRDVTVRGSLGLVASLDIKKSIRCDS